MAGSLAWAGTAMAQSLASGEPSGRVGRLAFVQGTVSFHDANRTDWQPATVNRPLSTGDAVWTEPNAHSEVSIAGTRVRLDGATQLDMATIDDQRTRLQIDQGRVDIKTFAYDARQPYDLVTPRGVATLQQQGDYYVEAGSTDDPTRLGVRAGAAQFQAPDGRVLAVRAGEVVEVTGDGSSMELHTIQAPPPPMPQYWAGRDRVVAYDQPPQYLSAGITGYEDLNYYGAWQNDPVYGQVWYVRDAPSGWAPYTTGRWDYQPVYGWTWVDEQPWGFAPYHYGRWAHRGERWFWVPPERSQPAVYAPALVAFVGGTELGLALGVQNRAPVGWFPLGPREVYVPPYTANRDYYRRLNLAARVQDRELEDRWQRVQRHEAVADQNWANRRFATVVPAEAFARSQPVERVALRVAPEKLAAAPVAAVAVPPSPTVSMRALQAPANTPNPPPRPGTPGQPNAPAAAQAQPAMLQAIKPEPQAPKAPGPQIATRAAVTTNADTARPALPKLEPRNASAPPPPQIQGERRPASTQPGAQQATAPASQPTTVLRPGELNKAPPAPPNQATLPAVRDRNGQPQANTPPNAPALNAPIRPGEPPRPPQASSTPQPPQPQHQATPPAAQPQHQAAPPAPQPQQQLQHQPPGPQLQQQTHAAPPPPQPQQPAAPPAPPPQAHAAPPPPPAPHPAAPPAAPPAPPPQAHAPAPPPPPAPHPAPPPPQQAQNPHPAPTPAPAPAPAKPAPPGQKQDEKK
jgi:hypothetical protein